MSVGKRETLLSAIELLSRCRRPGSHHLCTSTSWSNETMW